MITAATPVTQYERQREESARHKRRHCALAVLRIWPAVQSRFETVNWKCNRAPGRCAAVEIWRVIRNGPRCYANWKALPPPI
ncbi:hypothetical protein KCP73_11010 [Salmonella enterica subsp. enterica]|nr:hypothetical protein KCP73_11010 [Salmonella enterica subsp. enterica]